MDIDHDALLAAIDDARENSYGTDETSELGQKRSEAIEAYLGLNVSPAPMGRSQVVDRTVYQTIHTLLPSLRRIFAGSSEDVCKFVPVGLEDEQGAEQTTAVISHVVTQQNNWDQIWGDWCLDAMLLCNGYAMPYWDQAERVTVERYEGQSQDQMDALLADANVTVLEHAEREDEQGNADAARAFEQAQQQWQQMAMMAQAQGMPPPQPPQPPQPQMLHDLLIEKRETEGKVCISVLPPEHCYVSLDTPDWTLKECPYFEFRQEKTLSDLRQMGFDVADDISDNENVDAEETWARNRFGEDTTIEEGKGATRRVWVRMIWIRAALGDDEIARMYYAIVVGRTVLYVEPCGRIPVSSMVVQPMPHRHPGMSVAETVIDVQNVKTALKRGALDNLYITNAQRHLISQKVSLDDYLSAIPGMPIRLTDSAAMPGDGHIVPLQHTVAFEQIVGSLEYFDQDAQNRTGASRYFSGTDAGAINKTASGTIALQNMASMRVEDYARTMAPAVEDLFSIVHELVSKHSNKPMTVQLRGKWVTVDPQAWRTKRDVRISVGVGAGNKESQQQHLGLLYQTQMQTMPMGIAGPTQVHATLMEMAKLAGFANPQKFFIDPSLQPPPPPPPSPEQVKAQAEAQKVQFQAQQDQQKFQAEQALERERMTMQAQIDAQREEMQARQKALEAETKASLEIQKAQLSAQQEGTRLEFERWKAELDAAVKLQIAGMSGEVARDTTKAQQDPRIDELIQTMQALREESEAPAELVRGKDGRAEAVKRGNRVRRVVRDPATGRAVGLQ